VTALAIQGASSNAGKSLVTTALARALRRRGLDVVPFKAQNMSNNARVVAGGEIGTAQYLQALAAGAEPDVRMNPVLVKPENDTRSQVIVLGSPDDELSRLPWRERRGALWAVVEHSLRALLAEHELVLIEGAGSPAEINLRDTDLANMRCARLAGAPVVLVADIDRGGAFAHLYGTWALLDPADRRLLHGFVLNKFRGDATLLAPAPTQLEELTGVPTVGVLPWLAHGLPDEDGAASPRRSGRAAVAVVRYPTASNLDELKPLEQVADLRWAVAPRDLEGAALVVLPGSKNVEDDFRWLERSGIPAALGERRVLGICGGLQMLGLLGLLPVTTTFLPEKTTRRTRARFGALPAEWAALDGLDVEGYEIRHGHTRGAAEVLPDGLGYAVGGVLGVYLHGLFEQPAFVEALLGSRPTRTLDEAFDELADAAEEYLDVDAMLAACL
jgi:adenosylcobyric acid synthase